MLLVAGQADAESKYRSKQPHQSTALQQQHSRRKPHISISNSALPLSVSLIRFICSRFCLPQFLRPRKLLLVLSCLNGVDGDLDQHCFASPLGRAQ